MAGTQDEFEYMMMHMDEFLVSDTVPFMSQL